MQIILCITKALNLKIAEFHNKIFVILNKKKSKKPNIFQIFYLIKPIKKVKHNKAIYIKIIFPIKMEIIINLIIPIYLITKYNKKA